MAVQGALHDRGRTTSTSRRCAPASSSRTRAASPRCTTRTAGSARSASGSSSRSAARSRCASGSRSRTTGSTTPRAVGMRSGFGSPHLKLGYLKVFMDGTLGSQTAWMLDGSGVQITSGAELAEIVRRGAAAGFPVAVHAIGDRANREALDAFEETRDALAAEATAAADRARAAARPGGSAPLRRARRHLLGAVLARTVGPRPRRRVLGREDGRRLRIPVAARVGGGALQRQRRADRGARPARRHPRRRAPHDRRAGPPGTPSRR